MFHVKHLQHRKCGKVDKMTKSEVKKVIKIYGYTMIDKSWYTGKDKTGIIFNAYDDCGECSHFWIDTTIEFATRQAMSTICLHNEKDISNWFFM